MFCICNRMLLFTAFLPDSEIVCLIGWSIGYRFVIEILWKINLITIPSHWTISNFEYYHLFVCLSAWIFVMWFRFQFRFLFSLALYKITHLLIYGFFYFLENVCTNNSFVCGRMYTTKSVKWSKCSPNNRKVVVSIPTSARSEHYKWKLRDFLMRPLKWIFRVTGDVDTTKNPVAQKPWFAIPAICNVFMHADEKFWTEHQRWCKLIDPLIWKSQ